MAKSLKGGESRKLTFGKRKRGKLRRAEVLKINLSASIKDRVNNQFD